MQKIAQRWGQALGRLMLTSFLLVCGCHSMEGSRRWVEPFFFLQLADPQLGMWAEDDDTAREVAHMRRALAHANRLRPAFVVVCGDLINRPGDGGQAAELLRIAGELDEEIPLYWVAGNHDVGNDPSPESLAWYRRTFGEDRYVFYYGGYRFVVINSGVIHRPADVPDELMAQWRWLTEELHQGGPGEQIPTIVFQHHPLFLEDPDEEDGYFNIPKERRDPCLELFRESEVRAVFAGHYHRNRIAVSGDLEMVTSGPVGKPLGDDPSGLRIVKVFKDHIEHEYYGLDEVPERVHLPGGGRSEE